MDWEQLQSYVRGAKRFPLLRREEEISLARQIRAGGPDADAARTKFLNSNLRLVLSIACSFRWLRIPIEDLVQDGNLGLIRALEKYDPDRGFKFSTYASWWIRQSIIRAHCITGATIRIPSYAVQVVNEVRRAEEQLRYTLGCNPSDEDMASYLQRDIRSVKRLRNLPFVDRSINDPITEGDEDNGTLEDRIADEKAVDSEAAVILSDLQEMLPILLARTAPKTRLILILRYGDPPLSLEAVGKIVGLTRERIRQIIKRELPKLQARATKLGLDSG